MVSYAENAASFQGLVDFIFISLGNTLNLLEVDRIHLSLNHSTTDQKQQLHGEEPHRTMKSGVSQSTASLIAKTSAFAGFTAENSDVGIAVLVNGSVKCRVWPLQPVDEVRRVQSAAFARICRPVSSSERTVSRLGFTPKARSRRVRPGGSCGPWSSDARPLLGKLRVWQLSPRWTDCPNT